jgi:predicted lysophospholipase L1 biosynthesis ABC-type transport system permease subunit
MVLAIPGNANQRKSQLRGRRLKQDTHNRVNSLGQNRRWLFVAVFGLVVLLVVPHASGANDYTERKERVRKAIKDLGLSRPNGPCNLPMAL